MREIRLIAALILLAIVISAVVGFFKVVTADNNPSDIHCGIEYTISECQRSLNGG